jgi:hypothetical protein
MDYDFSGLCADQLEKLRKRLESLNKSFIKEYKIGLNVINSPNQNEHRGEVLVGVEDHLRDVVGKCEIFYTEAMNKVQRELVKFL